MFFIFPRQEVRSFWMRNTILPLDMIFVDTAGIIVTIRDNTTPYSEGAYYSRQPAKYVVEVNAGFTSRYNIKEGDLVTWKRNNLTGDK